MCNQTERYKIKCTYIETIVGGSCSMHRFKRFRLIHQIRYKSNGHQKQDWTGAPALDGFKLILKYPFSRYALRMKMNVSRNKIKVLNLRSIKCPKNFKTERKWNLWRYLRVNVAAIILRLYFCYHAQQSVEPMLRKELSHSFLKAESI